MALLITCLVSVRGEPFGCAQDRLVEPPTTCPALRRAQGERDDVNRAWSDQNAVIAVALATCPPHPLIRWAGKLT